MALHNSVLKIKELYYPNWPEERGMCPSCGCTYDLMVDDMCPDCGHASYVIFDSPLTKLDFS